MLWTCKTKLYKTACLNAVMLIYGWGASAYGTVLMEWWCLAVNPSMMKMAE